jgi:hypothetical protein
MHNAVRERGEQKYDLYLADEVNVLSVPGTTRSKRMLIPNISRCRVPVRCGNTLRDAGRECAGGSRSQGIPVLIHHDGALKGTT